MKHLYTEIDINAPVEKVWDILLDFEHYPDWNPFIKSIEGNAGVGDRLKVIIHSPDSSPMKFTPVCLKLENKTEFRWVGRLLIPGIFDGEHIFQLKEMIGDQTRFIQREKFKGILVPFFWRGLKTKTRKGFQLMNEKIKELAEADN